MQRKFIIIFVLMQLGLNLKAQQVAINISYSRLYTAYQFARKLSGYYPDNSYRQLLERSEFNKPVLKQRIAQLDTLDLNESYEFGGYPYLQKIPGTTIALLERNLVTSSNLREFKIKSYGLVPNESLGQLCEILGALLPITDSILYYPNQHQISEQISTFSSYIAKAELPSVFAKVQKFYGVVWDTSVPVEITVVPSLARRSFSAKAFLNHAVIELPVKYDKYATVTGVLMHEIFHLLYDAQEKSTKLNIDEWFTSHPSECSRYAYLLLNEALATALGNGYVYEQLNGSPDRSDWYDVKHINQMARQMYPLVESYIDSGKTMDKNFVDKYVDLYTQNFADWTADVEHILANRFVLADEREDLDFFTRHFPRLSSYQSAYPIDNINLDRLVRTPVTKVVIVSKDHEARLRSVKSSFKELSLWSYDPAKDFAFVTTVADKTRLIIINRPESSLDKIFSNHFRNNKIGKE